MSEELLIYTPKVLSVRGSVSVMKVQIVLGDRSTRAWHVRLVERLQALEDVEVAVRLKKEGVRKRDLKLEMLLKLEGFLSGARAPLMRRIGPTQVPISPRAQEDVGASGHSSSVLLDLTSTPSNGTWSVLFDGQPGEKAAVDALRAGKQPIVSVVDDLGVIRAQGRPGTENPGLFASALSDLGVGVATLVIGALRGAQFASPWEPQSPPLRPRSYAQIALRRVLGSGVHKLYRALYRAPHWRVGWRRKVGGQDLLAGGTLAQTAWQDLPDDGFHFYADPFLFEHDGLTYLFVEDFLHAEGKAVISVVQMGDEGPLGVPNPVLEHDAHLSYPFVLSHDGDVWMIPESSGARTLELYRAVDFPWKWELHSVLLKGEQISDATFFTHNGRWWLTATVGYGGSLSDSLCLWSAPDLRGPWSPHEKNPVLVDIASARPAGRVEQRDGLLLRPFQDGRHGYGAQMGVAQITRLDDEGFEQEVLAHFSAGNGWAGTRIHTFNQVGNLEVVDGSGFAPKFWFARMRPGL